MLLPVSMVAVASILASSASGLKHSLVFPGFSRQALHQLLASGRVSSLVTYHDHCHEVRTLLQEPDLQQRRISSLYLDSGERDYILDFENHHIDPIFALYTGGPSSLIAGKEQSLDKLSSLIMIFNLGTGELTGFYQATSSVQPQMEDNSFDIVEAVRDEEVNLDQPSFYEHKLKNDYRLAYIKDILDDDKHQDR